MKVYAIVAVWGNTKDNHAGMYYLAKRLKEAFGNKFVVVPTPTKGSRFIHGIYRLYNYLIGLWLSIVLRRNDKVFLMEYLLSETEQSDIARMSHKKCSVRGIAHLVPARLDKEYTHDQMLQRIGYLDRLYVLGSSLKQHFVRKGVSSEKISVTYHYVDTDYYRPANPPLADSKISVICMGNMERDYDTLLQIVTNCPTIRFIICKGSAPFPDIFNSLPNVELHGFMPEDKLRHLMQQSNISLNVMHDTIGSNVITTSLACGLAVVASNVGSISDYITDGTDGLLFDNTSECIKALQRLASDTELLQSMQTNARVKAEQISLQNFIKWFEREFFQVK